MEPLSEQQLQDYLKHLGLEKPTGPSRDNLNALIRAHLERIPFENLDVLLSGPLDLDDILNKVTQRGRGGYCFELNSLFARLLLALGYRLHLHAARIGSPNPDEYPKVTRLSHIVIYVELAEDGICLVDVGFWAGCLHRALSLHGETWPFRLRTRHPSRALEVSVPTSTGGWQIFYTVEPHAMEWVDIDTLNWYESTHPDSNMRHHLLAGRRSVKDGHWLRLLNNHFIRWCPKEGLVEKRIFRGEDEILDVLRNEFGLSLNPEKDVVPLRAQLRSMLGSIDSRANAVTRKGIWPEI